MENIPGKNETFAIVVRSVSHHVSFGKDKVSAVFSRERDILVILLVSSLLVLTTTSFACVLAEDEEVECEKEWVWALVCSACSVALTAVLLMLTFVKKGSLLGRGVKYVEVCLLPWWASGTFAMTIYSPYYWASYGYFGAWVALACSWMLAVLNFIGIQRVHKKMSSPWNLLLLADAFVVLQTAVILKRPTTHPWDASSQKYMSIAMDNYDDAEKKWSREFTLFCGLVSFIICGVRLALELAADQSRAECSACTFKLFESWSGTFSWISVPWWSLGVAVATFYHPFYFAGNGFFGCWGALFVSIAVFGQEFGWTWLAWLDTDLHMLPELLTLLLSSITVLSVSIRTCTHDTCDNTAMWSLISSSISILLVLVCIVAHKFDLIKTGTCFVSISFMMWLAGTLSWTSYYPCKMMSNGYVGAWTSLVSTVLLMKKSFAALGFSSVNSMVGFIGRNLGLTLVLPASFVLIVQGIVDCADTVCEGGSFWAILSGTVILVTDAVAILCKLSSHPKLNAFSHWFLNMLVLFVAIGCAGAFYCGDYMYMGNGSLSLLMILTGSVLVARKEYKSHVSIDLVVKDDQEAEAPPDRIGIGDAALSPSQARLMHSWNFIDIDMALTLFKQTSGKHFQATRVEVVRNKTLLKASSAYLDTAENRRAAMGAEMFHASIPAALPPHDRTAKRQLLRHLQKHFKTDVLGGEGLKKVNIILVRHGAAAAAVDSIAQLGIAALANPRGDDPGFFGYGRYSALEAEYACMYSTDYPEKKKPNLDGEFSVLLSAAVIMLAYPITPDKEDFTGCAPYANPQQCKFFGKPMQPPYDTHIAAVQGPDYTAVTPDKADFHELVCSQDAQLLPLAKVYFKKAT